MGMRVRLWCAALTISGVALASACSSAAPTDRATPAAPRTSQSVATRATARQEPTVHSSPGAPPFGYCGGLRSVTDTDSIVDSGLAVGFVRATVSAHGTPEAGATRASRVSHVTLLAGRLPGGRPARIDTIDLRPGRYLLLVGYARATYYVAAGLYGTFRAEGDHGFRLCSDYRSPHEHLVRTGVTTISGLTRLFARSLHKRS
jgi:hypothetical protein